MRLQDCAAGVVIAAFVAGSFALAQVSPEPSGPPAQLTLPPGSAQPTEPPSAPTPIECDLKASPDYVPGVDVNGREVVPADVQTGREIQIDSQVYVETRSKPRDRKRTGEIANLQGLGDPTSIPLQAK